MKRYIKLGVCLVILSAVSAFSQAVPAVANSPVAFVYVSSNPSGNGYEINAFIAQPSGQMTQVEGSPFSADVQNMAVNGRYLFGTNGVDIYSFSIASDGALQEVGSVNAQQFNGGNCGGPSALFLDHTGATLYDEDIYGNNCANNSYQSFTIEDSTGQLNYLGMTSDASPEFNVPLSFIGNDAYAYGSTCYHYNPSIFGFHRNNDGTLASLDINPPMPAAESGDFYCPYLAAEDTTNHLAISVQQLNSNWDPVGSPQLATYTADNLGNLTTNSTFSNMPSTAVRAVTDIWMSPSGELLAVAGTSGLQIFHFNGSNPITRYTGLLTRDEVDQLFWDNDNHVYAISRPAGKLFIFTVTSTSVSQAPGSPYTITNPQNIIVLPKT
jgi:hypothetical protein